MSGHSIPRELARDHKPHFFPEPTLADAHELRIEKAKMASRIALFVFLASCTAYGVLRAVDLVLLAFSK